LQIVGDGPLRPHLVQKSQELLNGKVEFQYLPPNEVINYYNTADLYVHAAAVEVECMTALEAMACGLPLLIADSELSATKQFAINENNLFATVDELTRKIEFWIEHRDELARSRMDYLEFVKNYRIEESYKKLILAYHKAIWLKKN
jgi:glycosyltransferase involved in cell wall biosynthesis